MTSGLFEIPIKLLAIDFEAIYNICYGILQA